MDTLFNLPNDMLFVIIMLLPYNEQLQLNRVCKAFTNEPSEAEHIKYVQNKIKTDKTNFLNILDQQLFNPFWVEKFGSKTLPFSCSKFTIEHQELLLQAYKNSHFPTIRAILLLCSPDHIVLKGKANILPFLNEIINETKDCRCYPKANIYFSCSWLYAYKFGCDSNTCFQIYDLVYEMIQLGYHYDPYYSFRFGLNVCTGYINLYMMSNTLTNHLDDTINAVVHEIKDENGYDYDRDKNIAFFKNNNYVIGYKN